MQPRDGSIRLKQAGEVSEVVQSKIGKMGALAAWELWDYIEANRRQLALRTPMEGIEASGRRKSDPDPPYQLQGL
jgi:hypothetical protein